MPEPVIPVGEITEKNLKEDPGGILLYDDEASLKIVLEDAERADNFININQWAAGWVQSDIIQQSPSNSTLAVGASGATVPKFTVSNHLSAIIPEIMGGIFYEDPPFLLRPRPGTSQAIIDAKTALFTYQLDDMNFQEEVECGLDQMGLFGTGIWKWGWLEKTNTEKQYVRKAKPTVINGKTIHTKDSDDFDIEYNTKDVRRPWFKSCDIRTVLVDPGCRRGDIQKAKWAIYRDYPTYEDLDNLRGVDGYDIPEVEELKNFFLRDKSGKPGDNLVMTLPENMRGWLQHAMPRNYNTSADPLQNPLELLERWDKDKVIVVLRHKDDCILIRNEANPYHKLPFFSANWRNLVDSFYGQGLGMLIGSEQIVEQGITNMALGLLGYGLQPTAVRKKGFNTPTQQIRWKQGGIIDVEDDVEKAFKFLQMPGIPGEAWAFLQQTQAASQETSGANQQVTLGAGAAGVRSTGMRSGTGAGLVGKAAASRLDGPTGRFIRQVFVPWLYEMDEMNNTRLPASLLRAVLAEEMGDAAEIDHIEFRNAKLEYEVLAGSHLGPRREMAQFMPFIVQMINNPTFAEMIHNSGFMFDAVAVFKEFANLAGWKYSQSFLRKMTDTEQQKADANSPARLQQMKLGAAQQLQQQQFQQQEQLADDKQLGKAGGEVIRTAWEHALEGTSGYGTITAL